MSKFKRLFTLLLVLGVMLASETLHAGEAENNFVVLLIKFHPQITDDRAREVLTESGALEFRPLAIPRQSAKPPMNRWWSAQFKTKNNAPGLVQVIKQYPEVEEVELDQEVKILPGTQ